MLTILLAIFAIFLEILLAWFLWRLFLLRDAHVEKTLKAIVKRVDDLETALQSYESQTATTAPFADMGPVYSQLTAVDKRATDTSKQLQYLKRTVDRREHWHSRQQTGL